MFELIHAGVTALNTVLYDFYIVPLFLIIAGIFLSVRLGFPQVRHFVEMLRVTRDKPLHAHGISSFGALMVSTASRVGTGNIVGVSTGAPVHHGHRCGFRLRGIDARADLQAP